MTPPKSGMPFPLAHPAAVLPLRRYCPRFLSFPALVVGSVVPDLGYFFSRLEIDAVAHHLKGLLLFSLPAGIIALLVLYGSRSWLLAKVPARYQPDFLKQPWPPCGSPLVVVASLVLGASTHLLLDSFTHKSGWFVERLPLLQFSLGHLFGRSVRVCSVLWYGCSFLGIGLVFLAFRNWQQSFSGAPVNAPKQTDWQTAVLVSAAVLPIELVHHLVRSWVGMFLVGLLSLVLVLLTTLKTRSATVQPPS